MKLINPFSLVPEGFKAEAPCETGVRRFSLNNSRPDAMQISDRLYQMSLEYGKQPALRDFALWLASNSDIAIGGGLQQNDVEAHFDGITSFILRNMVYVRDPNNIEFVQSPWALLRQLCQGGQVTGDCDDTALLTNSLMESLGFETRICAVDTGNTGKFNHVLCLIKYKNKWVFFDGCNKQSPFTVWKNIYIAGEPII